MTHNEERLEKILNRMDAVSHIPVEEIPDIGLYMDQVTSLMETRLGKTRRSPEDKVLTRTMINNYTKNNLIPPPEKKKYSRAHVLLLIFIYYYKNMLSFNDIEQLLCPLTEKHFGAGAGIPLSQIYEEVFSLGAEASGRLKEDILEKFKAAAGTFPNAEGEDQEFLQLFAFISELAFDVYIRKQMIEALIDQLRAETQEPSGNKKKRGR